MPIYEYKCNECGDVFSKLVFSQTAEINCPKCGSDKADKLMSVISSCSGGSASTGGCGSSGFS